MFFEFLTFVKTRVVPWPSRVSQKSQTSSNVDNKFNYSSNKDNLQGRRTIARLQG